MTQDPTQIQTFYSGKFEQQCYLCQHGLHGKEQQMHTNSSTAGQVAYATPDVVVKQAIGEPISSKKPTQTIAGSTLSQVIGTPQKIEFGQTQQMQTPPQNFQVSLRQDPQIIQQNMSLAIQQPIIKNDSKQVQTFFSDKFEQQCYLCQHGLHGKESENAHIISQEFAYSTPDVIVYQTIGEPLNPKKPSGKTYSQIVDSTQIIENQEQTALYQQNLSQTIQQPIIQNQQMQIQQMESPRVDYSKSQYISTPPPQNIQAPQQQSPQIVQQSVQQQIIPAQQMQMQSNQFQQINQQLIPQTVQSQIISQPPQQIQQQSFGYNQDIQTHQLNYAQNQVIIPQAQIQQIPATQVIYKQIIPSSQQYIQNSSTFGQGFAAQQLSPRTSNVQTITTVKIDEKQKELLVKEQVELFWRQKVYELQDRVYELVMQINNQKQQVLLHQRSGSQVKSQSSVDPFKLQQLQTEVQKLDSQLKIKSMTAMDMRNKLNEMIYKQDPTEDATRYKEQELQQMRQRYNTLNFKVQSNQEDIAMTQAVIEAIKSGKSYKLVSIKTQQQSYTGASQQQYQNQGAQSYKAQQQ